MPQLLYVNTSIKPGSGTFQTVVNQRGCLANLSISEYAGVAGVLTWYNANGEPNAMVLQASGQMLIRDISVHTIELTGNGSDFTIAVLEAPARIDPQFLQQAPTPNTNVNIAVDSVGIAKDTTVASTNAQLTNVILSNTGAAPATGVIVAFLEGSGSEPTLAIGAGSAQKINGGVSLASGSGLTYRTAVQSGQTVTFASCTVRSLIFAPTGG